MSQLLLFHAGAREVPDAASTSEPFPQATASGQSAFFCQAIRAIRGSRQHGGNGSSQVGKLMPCRGYDIACAFVTHFEQVYIIKLGSKLKAGTAIPRTPPTPPLA